MDIKRNFEYVIAATDRKTFRSYKKQIENGECPFSRRRGIFLEFAVILHYHIICNSENKTKQDRQCTYNVTLRRVHENTVATEKQ
jgi:hypothetical protein